MEEGSRVSENPWWHPSDDDLGWDEPLPRVIRLSPDYGAPLPLWGEGFGNIAWQYTKFPPELLDRLAAWQQAFDAHWESDDGRDGWASQAEALAADVRAALGGHAEVVVDLWPLGRKLKAALDPDSAEPREHR